MNLDKPEIIARLTVWQSIHQEANDQIGVLYKSFGAAPDSPLIDSIYRLMDEDTKKLAELVGDDTGSIVWFETECELGKSPNMAAPPCGEFRLIVDIDKLADLIAYKEI